MMIKFFAINWMKTQTYNLDQWLQRKANNNGLSGHPCLVPPEMDKLSEYVLPNKTLAMGFEYKTIIMEIYGTSKPMFQNLPKIMPVKAVK